MNNPGLVTIDYIIIAAYLAMTIGVGWYHGRRQKNAREYFIGSGNMNTGLIGVSLFATLLSTISYLALPGETIGKGPYILASSIAKPVSFIIVGYILIPAYMRQRVTSAYELLEERLGLQNRLLTGGRDRLLLLVDRRRGLECDAADEVLAVGDSALDPAGVVAARANLIAILVEGIVVGRTRQPGSIES